MGLMRPKLGLLRPKLRGLSRPQPAGAKVAGPVKAQVAGPVEAQVAGSVEAPSVAKGLLEPRLASQMRSRLLSLPRPRFNLLALHVC